MIAQSSENDTVLHPLKAATEDSVGAVVTAVQFVDASSIQAKPSATLCPGFDNEEGCCPHEATVKSGYSLCEDCLKAKASAKASATLCPGFDNEEGCPNRRNIGSESYPLCPECLRVGIFQKAALPRMRGTARRKTTVQFLPKARVPCVLGRLHPLLCCTKKGSQRKTTSH